MHFQMSGDIISAIVTCFVGLAQFSLPVLILALTIKPPKKQRFLRFASLFEGLKHEALANRLCALFFVLRRILLVLAAVLLSNYPTF